MSQVKGILQRESLLSDFQKLVTLKPGLYLLKGTLGTGKTTLVKAITKSLLGDDYNEMSSPTYSLLHMYEASNITINHLDLYRLKNESELQELAISDLISDDLAYTFIEWPELLTLEGIPHIVIELAYNDELSRTVTITHINHE